MDDKRERILTAARKRFRHFGVKKTTMQEIAGDAGVAVGTLYLYFKDKDDLLVACTEEYIARHRREAETILASDAPAGEKLRQYALDRFRAAEATRTGYRQAAELTREVLRVRPERRLDEGRMMTEYFVRFLRLGIEAGELYTDDPERDARVLLFSLAFFFPGALQDLPYPPKEEDLLLVVDWFLDTWASRVA
ncbi:MAG TPA: TetR/AcrR family transcriptional regulator [Planctomycetales bacterium]|nr:TetR/AcrR family transcriptional regulator [Planctomycetales bacterium]